MFGKCIWILSLAILLTGSAVAGTIIRPVIRATGNDNGRQIFDGGRQLTFIAASGDAGFVKIVPSPDGTKWACEYRSFRNDRDRATIGLLDQKGHFVWLIGEKFCDAGDYLTTATNPCWIDSSHLKVSTLSGVRRMRDVRGLKEGKKVISIKGKSVFPVEQRIAEYLYRKIAMQVQFRGLRVDFVTFESISKEWHAELTTNGRSPGFYFTFGRGGRLKSQSDSHGGS